MVGANAGSVTISDPTFRLRAGGLRHKVAIERATETIDAAGAIVQTWEWVADRRAKVEALSGREFEIASQVNNQISRKVTIRAFKELRQRDRFIFKDRVFHIQYFNNPLEEDKLQVCFCTEVYQSTGDPLE